MQIATRKNLVSSLSSETPEQQKELISEVEISKDSTTEPPTEVLNHKGAYLTSSTSDSLTPVINESKSLKSRTAPPKSIAIEGKIAAEEEKPVTKASKEEKPGAKAPKIEKIMIKPTKEETVKLKASNQESLGTRTKTVEKPKIVSPPSQEENKIGKKEKPVVVPESKDSEEELDDSGPLAGVNVMNVIVVAAECAPWAKTGVCLCTNKILFYNFINGNFSYLLFSGVQVGLEMLQVLYQKLWLGEGIESW